MKRVFIIHGWGGFPSHGWYPWLKEELEKRKFSAHVPDIMFKISTFNEVIARISNSVGTPDEDTYLVGHSAGCMAILKYLENLKENEKIGGIILVSAFADKIGHKDVDGFFENPVDWEKARKHGNRFVVIQSDNDYYVPMEYGNIFKERLGAKLIIEHEKGHFSQDDGITELPVVLDELLKMAQ